MNLSDKIYSVLKEAYPALKTLDDNWFIIGSSGLVLAGVEIKKTSDIDILTSVRDAQKLKLAWDNRRIKDFDSSDTELFCSDLSKYDFNILDIEISGGLKVYKSKQWTPLKIKSHICISTPDFEVKIPTLEEQKRIFLLFGREKDLQKVKKIDF